MTAAVIALSGVLLYGVAAVLALAVKKARKLGLVLIFPALAMISYPFVALHGPGLLIPIGILLLIALFAVRRIWNG